MSTSSGPLPNDEWLDEFLALPSRERQLEALRAADLADPEGLARLLERASALVREDPGRARHLAVVCGDAAMAVGARGVIPRATYLQAQTHALRGEFHRALDLIYAARDAYEQLGQALEALRTNLGLMHVLNEVGRHQEALEAGQAVLDAVLGREDEFDAPEQTRLVAAIAQQNRGVCFETIGRYEDALDAYAAAESYFAELGMPERLSDIRNNRGIVLVHLGRVSEALGAFDAAAAIREQAGLTFLRAQTLSNLGDAYLLLGDYSRGLDAFERARRLFDSLDALASQQILLRKTADAYLALNLFPEAEDAYREAIALLQDAGMADHHARALWGLGATLRAQSKVEDAAAALAQSADLFADADNVPMLCSVMVEQAALQHGNGERDAALETARDALQLVAGDTWPVQQIYARMRVADLLRPNIEAAEQHLRSAKEAADALALPTLQYRINRRLGRLRLLQERNDEAETLLQTAVEQIESLRGTLAHEAVRTSFLRDKTAAYEDLVRLYLGSSERDTVERAFAVAEHAKSRTLVDLLAGIAHATSASSNDAALPDARLQILQADLHAVYNEFLATDRRGNDVPLSDLQDRARELERKISRLRLQTGDDPASIDPFASPLTLHQIREQIPSDVTLLAYHVLGDEILAFVSWEGHLHVVRELSTVETVRPLLQRLYVQWNRFRAGPDFVRRHMAQLEQTTQRILAALYDEIAAPLLPILDRASTGSTKLTVVPHDLLHQIPYHALYDGERYLVDRFEISYAPSATVLALCQQRNRWALRNAVIVGLADPLIPAVNGEVHDVARELRDGNATTKVQLNENATAERLKADVAGCDVLHLACHGIFRADNPMFSALQLKDRWLTAAEILSLDTTDAVVTLSACESGRSQVIQGDEVIGLPRAFLGAGAATVVVSLWLVHDESTAIFMREWYRGLRRGLGRARALRAAQQALRERYSHPYYWAPFVLIGQR